jgi:hypothetical protein
MTNADAVKQIDAIIGSLTNLKTGLQPPPLSTYTVTAGVNLRALLEAVPSGALVRCEPATYAGPFVLSKPVTITSTLPPKVGRATADAAVWLTSGEETVTIVGSDVTLSGIGVKSTNPDYQLVNIPFGAQRTVLDQVTALGDPVKGQRRGLRPEGADVKILRCYVDHIGGVGRETQGIGFSLGGSDITIDDCHVSGAAEAIMVGGSDTPSAERIPQRIRITRSTLTKRPEWYGMNWQIKNALELKCAIDVTVSECLLQYAGISEGQGAYLIVLTPRNQDGAAPWSTVQRVLIERIHGVMGGGCVSFMGSDYSHPSGPLKDIVIREALFDGIDPQGPTKGDGRCFFFTRAPQHVTLENITVKAKNMTSNIYLGPYEMPPTGLVLRNLVLPAATYPIKIDGGGQGEAALKAWAPDVIMERVGTADATGATP